MTELGGRVHFVGVGERDADERLADMVHTAARRSHRP